MENPIATKFLTAEWRNLAIFNYKVDPSILFSYLPHGTELDFWDGSCYVSLVGFRFSDTRLRGVRIPFHSDFEEVNLRFYVRYREDGVWKRGVTFVKELVPKYALTFVANRIYGEKYETVPMTHTWLNIGNQLQVEYKWKKRRWHGFRIVAENRSAEFAENSREQFITEHYWGYTKLGDNLTAEYGVEHPKWKVHPVKDYSIDVDFGMVYGSDFSFLTEEKPASVMLAEGSEIVVRSGRRL